MIGYTKASIESMSTLKYFLSDAAKNKARVHQLDCVKYNVFVKFYSRYGEHFPEYANYFGRSLSLNK